MRLMFPDWLWFCLQINKWRRRGGWHSALQSSRAAH